MALQTTLLFYNGSYYGITDVQSTREISAQFAVSIGGQLAKIESEGENAAILKLAQAATTSGSANDGGGAKYVWLGLNDVIREGAYIWQDGSPLSGFNKWGSSGLGSEPDNFNGQQDGVGLALQNWPIGTVGQWNDINISNSLMAVVEFDQAAFNALNYVGTVIDTNDNVVFNGTAADDTILASAQNDAITGLGGNDSIDGGPGDDTAIFSGPRADYVVFTATTGKTMVVDTTVARDGKDSLQNVEHIRFGTETVTLANALVEPADADNSAFQVYRFYNTQTGSHFFTTSLAERNSVIETLDNLSYEGNSFDSNVTDVNGTAVFRFFNLANNVHFYTANADEAAGLRQNAGFRDEGISYYASNDASNGGTELYRFFNTQNGSHFYTVSATERDNIIGTLGHYNYEGVAFFVDVA